MDTTWIILVWLLAIAGVYAAVTRWSRMSQVRRRLFQGMPGEQRAQISLTEPVESALGRWLLLAGYRGRGARASFVLVAIAFALLGFVVLLLALQGGASEAIARHVAGLPPAVAVIVGPVLSTAPYLLALLLVALPWLHVRARRKKRVLELERSLPITLDLMATMSETGLGFDSSLAKVIDSSKDEGPLTEELSIFQLEALAGIPRIQCFRRLAQRCEVPSMSIFCSALVQAEQVGAGYSTVLRHQADDLRSRRRERALVLAQALPVKLVFPLVICFLPGIFLTTLGPAFMQFLQMAEGVIRAY